MTAMLIDLDAYRQRSPGVKAVHDERVLVMTDTVEQSICRRRAQAAVGRTPLRDVLLSLRRAGVIVAFRIHADRIVVEVERTLPFLFETCDLS